MKQGMYVLLMSTCVPEFIFTLVAITMQVIEVLLHGTRGKIITILISLQAYPFGIVIYLLSFIKS